MYPGRRLHAPVVPGRVSGHPVQFQSARGQNGCLCWAILDPVELPAHRKPSSGSTQPRGVST